MRPVIDEIYIRFGENVYGEDDESLEGTVVKLLSEKGLTVACAESCTGGSLTSKLVDFPGVSAVLLESAVTYSNNAKMNRLGVTRETLINFGAVSRQTASEMAKGIAITSGADIGISTTGIAGPDGGSEKKSVGLVYIGLYVKGEITVRKLNLAGSRARVRDRTVITALDTLRRGLMKI
jgi:nicotinamide-nucleotide amidase